MNDKKGYLYATDSGTLQLPHDQYVALMETAEKTRHLQQVVPVVLSDLRNILDCGSVAEPVEAVKPVEVVEPVEAVEPEEATEPEEVAEAVEAVEPEEATEPEEAAKPEEATEPEEAAKPEEAIEPEEVAEAEVASEAEEATEPVEATEPEEVAEAEVASEPEEVAEAEEATEPVEMAEAEEASEPEEAVDPEEAEPSPSPAKEPEPEKVSAEFEEETPVSSKPPTPEKACGRKVVQAPPIKKKIARHFNKFDNSGRLFSVFTQYYTCLNDMCGGKMRITMKDGICSLWNYSKWEEFAFVDISEDLLRISIGLRYTDALESLNLCEPSPLVSSRRSVVCVQVGDLNNVVLEVLAKAFAKAGKQAK